MRYLIFLNNQKLLLFLENKKSNKENFENINDFKKEIEKSENDFKEKIKNEFQ